VYSNAAIDAAVQHTGFTRVVHERGVVWAVALYERTGAASDTNPP
jgi:hypothetical protein